MEEQPAFTRAKELPEPWRSHFPKSQEEAAEWRPHTRYLAFYHSRIMIVVKTRVECAWCCYIGVVDGEDHSREWEEVLRHGNKLPERIARVIFPEFEGVPYAH